MASEKWSDQDLLSSVDETTMLCAITDINGQHENRQINFTGLGLAKTNNPTFTGTVKIGGVNGAVNAINDTNTSIGANAMINARLGVTKNTAIGEGALLDAGVGGTGDAGYGCTAVGNYSLHANTIGTNNTAIGIESSMYITTGVNNITIGSNSGGISAAGLTTGSENIYIGASSTPSSPSVSNEIVIANSMTGKGSDTISIGRNTNKKTYLKGEVNIVSTAPTPTGTINMQTYSGGPQLTSIYGTGTNFDSYSIGDTITFMTSSGTFSGVIETINGDFYLILNSGPVTNIVSSPFTISRANPAMSDAPSGSNSTGVAGDVRFCIDAIYVCVATNTWKRTPISTWP